MCSTKTQIDGVDRNPYCEGKTKRGKTCQGLDLSLRKIKSYLRCFEESCGVTQQSKFKVS